MTLQNPSRHCIALTFALTLATLPLAAQQLNLPTSHRLQLPVPGAPQRTNSLPVTLALSPDGRYAVTLNTGYGTLESHFKQSLSVLDLATNTLTDVPDDNTVVDAHQIFFSGLAFSADGTHLFAALASLTDPTGQTAPDTGAGLQELSFAAGRLTPTRFFPLPLVALAPGHTTELGHAVDHKNLTPELASKTRVTPYVAAIAVLPNGQLLLAENLSDTVALFDPATGTVLQRFDLAIAPTVPSAFPIALAVTHDGTRAFVALWNASEVAELDLTHRAITRHLALLKPHADTAPGSHPVALLLDEAASRLYVALANRDTVAALDLGTAAHPALSVAGYFDTRLPGQHFFGAIPNALALSADRTRLFAANMGTDSIAVLDPRKLRPLAKTHGMAEPIGFIPTEWLPISLAATAANKLLIATGKGQGTGPNNMPAASVAETAKMPRFHRDFTFIPTLIHGSLASFDLTHLDDANLKSGTATVLANNRVRPTQPPIAFAAGRPNPIRHVIYIIRENRTYDQVLGDLAVNGKPVANGDPSLTMYGASITPNFHKLALQFGVLDNFYDSAEVSGDGHVWSNAAIGTDYLERTWQQDYRSRERTYDFEGRVAEGFPLLQHIPDVNEAPSGYLWTNLAAHGKSLLHFGEYIASDFCDEKAPKAAPNPTEGAMSGRDVTCREPFIQPGKPLPAEWGGGPNLWPWPIPRLASNTATKPELVGHFAPEAPDFNLRIPDQVRVNIFLRHLDGWKRDRAAGHDTMPAFIMLRLPNDHTEGTKVGGPTPNASVADNDLAVGRAVEAISHSAFWDDTAFFILEDDAQNGADHVDAHRSVALVISKYAPHAGASAQGSAKPAVVDSTFYTTISVIRTMEQLLDLPPMNMNDAFAPSIASLFTGPGDQPPFIADTTNRDNRLIYTANKKEAPGAAASARLDFRHPDRADPRILNTILWQDAKGPSTPIPPQILQKPKKDKDDD